MIHFLALVLALALVLCLAVVLTWLIGLAVRWVCKSDAADIAQAHEANRTSIRLDGIARGK